MSSADARKVRAIFRKRPDGRFQMPSVAGKGLPERLRTTAFAFLGLTAAAGLAFVAFFAQLGFPLLAPAPLPSSPPDQGVVAEAVPLGPGSDASGLGQARSAPASLGSAEGDRRAAGVQRRERGEAGVAGSPSPVSAAKPEELPATEPAESPADSPAPAPAPVPAPAPESVPTASTEPAPAVAPDPSSKPAEMPAKPDSSRPVAKPARSEPAKSKPVEEDPKPPKAEKADEKPAPEPVYESAPSPPPTPVEKEKKQKGKDKK